jgi:acetyltransferase-like isoleucine patch superfamily enzyme
MKIFVLLRRGEGPFWGGLKRMALAVLHLHLPVGPLNRPVFRMLYGLHVTVREGILWMLRVLWYEPLFRSQCASVGRGFLMEQLPYVIGQGKIFLGDHVTFAGKPSFGFGNRWNDAPEIFINSNSFIGHDCRFSVAEAVRIGRYCLLAGGVSVSDYDGHPTDAASRRLGCPNPPEAIRPVVIGDDVWIGANAIILKGVTIGDRSIVGAGAVVSRAVPPDVVVVGNPARVVKSLPAPRADQATARPIEQLIAGNDSR